jgi:hypothetical protein
LKLKYDKTAFDFCFQFQLAPLNHGLALPPGVDAADLAAVRRAAEVRHSHRANNDEAAALGGGARQALISPATSSTRVSSFERHPST